MSNLQHTLAERGKHYGSFEQVAKVSQSLKAIVLANEADLTASQAEALEMICVKLARITNGNPNHLDSWHDIAGYAQLVAMELAPVKSELSYWGGLAGEEK